MTSKKRIKDAIAIIRESLEANDQPIEGDVGFLIHYLEANVEDLVETLEEGDDVYDDFDEEDDYEREY